MVLEQTLSLFIDSSIDSYRMMNLVILVLHVKRSIMVIIKQISHVDYDNTFRGGGRGASRSPRPPKF